MPLKSKTAIQVTSQSLGTSILNPKYSTLISGANTRVMNIPNYSKI